MKGDSQRHSSSHDWENADCVDGERKRNRSEAPIGEERAMKSYRDGIHEGGIYGSCDFAMPSGAKRPSMELHSYGDFIIPPCDVSAKQSSHEDGYCQQQEKVHASKKKKKKSKAKFEQSIIGKEGMVDRRDSSNDEENENLHGFSKMKKPLIELSEYESFVPSPAEEPLSFSLPCENTNSDEKGSSLAECFSLKLSAMDDIQGVEDTEHGSNGHGEASSDREHLLSHCKEMLRQSKHSIMGIRLEYGEDIWSLSSQVVNPYETVPSIAIDVLNRAFFKMWELMQLFPNLVPENSELFSAHLCEGPGGFIQSLLVYRSKKRADRGDWVRSSSLVNCHDATRSARGIRDAWFAITLATPNSHCKALKMDLRKLKASVDEFVEGHLHYGDDGSGDVTNPGNISSFVEFTLQKSDGKKMHLITGDGAFDISEDFASQEHSHSHLLYCEMVLAVQLQCHGGSFVLKLFDCFSESTRTILRILASLYAELEIVGLRMSRVCSSERYLVARGFLGLPDALKDRLMCVSKAWYDANARGESAALCLSKALPRRFSSALDDGNMAFANRQIASIMQAVGLARKLGGKISSIDATRRKSVLSIVKRKLKHVHKLNVNALLLCQALDIPVLECYR